MQVLASYFFEKGNIDSAKQYFFISKAYAKKLNNNKLGMESLIGLASIHEIQNNLDSALFYYNSALKIAIKAKRVGNIKKYYQHLSDFIIKKVMKINHKNMLINLA